MRRIGVLLSTVESDPRGLEYITAFAQGLAELGWTVGRNVRIEYRWGAGDPNRFRRYAAELVALSPDVVLASGGTIVEAFQQASHTIPIVFVNTIDPVGGGYVESLARPGTNATGFASFEFSMSGKWLELLKEIAPGVKRVAVIRDASVPAGSGGFAAIQTVAPSLGVELTPVGVRDSDEIERAITTFARASNGALIVVGPVSSVRPHYDLIIAAAARHRLPAVYPNRPFVISGGLMSYGNDPVDPYRRAAYGRRRRFCSTATTSTSINPPSRVRPTMRPCWSRVRICYDRRRQLGGGRTARQASGVAAFPSCRTIPNPIRRNCNSGR